MKTAEKKKMAKSLDKKMKGSDKKMMGNEVLKKAKNDKY